MLAFSEFGRRVQENRSGGTDHGAAGPMFLLGKPVSGGLFGAHPSLEDLDAEGNLMFTTDFREVYATLSRDWFGCDPQAVLGAEYGRLPIVRT